MPHRTRSTAAAIEAAHKPQPVDGSPSRQRFAAIHERLRERIALLDYPPGTRLDIDRLSAEFEVSRTPIRGVLQRLEYQGMVITRHGVGTTVTPVVLDGLREALALRMRLAELIGELSPRPCDAPAVGRVEQALARCQGLPGESEPRAFAAIDIDVHGAVCGLIGNRHLRQVYDETYYRTVRMWFLLLPRLDWRTEVSIFTADTGSILGAMQRDDARGVGLALRGSLHAALERLAALFNEPS